MNTSNKQYRLRLSDGTVWGMRTVPAFQQWLDDFASIMGFEASSDSNNVTKEIRFIEFGNNDLINEFDTEWAFVKQGKVYKIWHKENESRIFIELNKEFIDHPEIRIINMWSTLKAIYRYYSDIGGGPAHAASAALRGNGIIICAAGGTGKSTCIERLPDNWEKLSDDNSLIVPDKKINYRVHPMPTWSDHLWKTKNSSINPGRSVPLKAIFFLSQSKKDMVKKMPSAISAQSLYKSFFQIWQNYFTKISENEKRTMNSKLFDVAYSIAKSIPCYYLEATLRGKFWEEIESVL